MPLIHPPHDPRRTDSRLYKGGDGGAGQLREDEQERQRKVQSAVDAINTKFGQGAQLFDEQAYLAQNPDVVAAIKPGGFTSGQHHYDMYGRGEGRAPGGGVDPAGAENKAAREALYTDISSAVRDTAMRDLDRQYTTASRRNKFGLARSGLLGGSADVESGGELQTLYGEGRLRATEQGQKAGSELRSNDEQTRQRLIQLAQSGLDVGTAGSLAAGQMSAAADVAKADAAGSTVGRLFDDLSQAYTANRQLQARNAATQPTTTGYSYSAFGPKRVFGNIQG